jgi:endonuclease/exonuclease/phosphatase (EEP) superfamily protein YafD
VVGRDNLPSLGQRGGSDRAVQGAIRDLTATRPDHLANVLPVDYRAHPPEEVIRMVRAIIEGTHERAIRWYGLRVGAPGGGRPGAAAGTPGVGLREHLSRWVAVYSLLYLAGIVLLVLLLSSGVDWWPLTLLRFGPRWVVCLPLALLVPWAAVVRPRMLVALAGAAVLAVGPVLGFNVPWRRLTTVAGPRRPGLLIMTLNVERAEMRHRGLLGALIARTRPDVVALQEFSGPTDDLFPPEQGWTVRSSGGLGLATRLRVEGTAALNVVDPVPRRAGLRCDARAPWGVIHLVALHLTTPRAGLKAVLARGCGGIPALKADTVLRRRMSEAAGRWVVAAGGPVLIAGDFNQPSDDPIYRGVWSAYRDGFESAGLGFGLTKYMIKYIGWYGARIDHILGGAGWRFRRCWVGPDVGSDHRPVFAEVEWVDPR